MKLTTTVIAMLVFLIAGVNLFAGPFIDKDRAAGVRNFLPAPSRVPHSATSRIEVVVLENQSYRNVIGNARAPYTNYLANRYGLATRMFAVTHPSLPNYLAMTAGKTYGLQSNFPASPLSGPNLMTQLGAAGSSWGAYFAGVPTPCYSGPAVNGYSKGLNPFIVNRHILTNPKSCSKLVPMSRLSSELLSGKLPDLAWISPNLTQNGHDSNAGVSDAYLSKLVPALIPSLGPKGVLLVLWDEGKTDHSKGRTSKGINGTRGGGRIPAIVVGPGVRPGATTSTPMTSYSVLRFIEHLFELPYLNHASRASDVPLRSLFLTPPSLNRGS